MRILGQSCEQRDRCSQLFAWWASAAQTPRLHACLKLLTVREALATGPDSAFSPFLIGFPPSSIRPKIVCQGPASDHLRRKDQTESARDREGCSRALVPPRVSGIPVQGYTARCREDSTYLHVALVAECHRVERWDTVCRANRASR